MTESRKPIQPERSAASTSAVASSTHPQLRADHKISPLGFLRHLVTSGRELGDFDHQAVLAQLPWALLVHDSSVIRYANGAAAGLFGCPDPSALVGKPLDELVCLVPSTESAGDNPEDGPDASELVQRRCTLRLLRHDGGHVDVEATETSIQSRGRDYVGLHLHRIASAPSEQELPLEVDSGIKSMLEVSPDFVMLVTPTGRIEYLNRTNGRTPIERFVGSSIFDLPREPYVPILRSCIDRVMQTGKVDQCELEYKNQFNENRRFETRIGPVYRAGRMVALAVNCRDISKHRPRAPQPLERELPINLALRQTVSDASAVCRRSTNIRQGQRPAFETLLAELSIELKCRTREENLDDLVQNVLQKTAEFLGAQRGLLLQFQPEGDLLRCTHQWTRDGEPRLFEPQVSSPSTGYQWLSERLRGGVPYVTGPVAELLDGTSTERSELLRRGVCSLVALPLCLECQPIGALCFEGAGPETTWPDASIARLGIIGGLIVNAIVRMQTVNALRRAHHELQHVTASVSAGLWSMRVGPDGQWYDHYRSPVMEQITGRTVEFYGSSPQRWLATVHEEDRAAVLEVLQRLLRSAPTHDEIEYRIILPDGTIRWVRNSTNARRLPDDTVRLDGVLANITDRKRAEAAMRENEEQRRRYQEELAHAGRLSTLGELVAEHRSRDQPATLRHRQLCRSQQECPGGPVGSLAGTGHELGQRNRCSDAPGRFDHLAAGGLRKKGSTPSRATEREQPGD